MSTDHRAPATSRSRTRWLLGAAASVILVSLVAPTTAPLYDGIGFPDEPYRFVTKPAGDTTATKPPTGFRVSATGAAGVSSQQVYGNSTEQGPQVGIYLPRGSMAAPGATTFELIATPTAPTHQPADGVIDGNTYVFTATSDAGPATFTAMALTGVLVERASTPRQPGPQFEYLAPGGSTPKPLKTERIGNDLYQTLFAGAGEYSLAFITTHAAGAGSSPPYALIILGAVILAFMVGTVLVVRRTRSRHTTA